MLDLEGLQFAEQAVVLGIRNRRRVKHIVGMVMPRYLFAQRPDALLRS